MINGTPTNIALKKTEFLASPSDATDSLELDLEQGDKIDEIDKIDRQIEEIDKKSVENGINFETFGYKQSENAGFCFLPKKLHKLVRLRETEIKIRILDSHYRYDSPTFFAFQGQCQHSKFALSL